MHARFVNTGIKVPHLFKASPFSLADFYLGVWSKRGERIPNYSTVLICSRDVVMVPIV